MISQGFFSTTLKIISTLFELIIYIAEEFIRVAFLLFCHSFPQIVQ